MNLSVSPQMRVVALAGLLALLALTVGVFALSHRSSSTSSAEPAPVLRPHNTTPSKTHAPTPSIPKPAPTRPQLAPAVKAALAEGWPRTVADAFVGRRVVVVELYSPESSLDRQALAEATAGASEAGAALVPLDVTATADASVRAVLRKVGIVDAPAALVLRRPGTIFVQLDGFADQATIAQAAANAATS